MSARRREYESRLRERRRDRERLRRIDRRMSIARGVVVLAGLIMAWAVFDPARLHVGWLAAPIVALLVLAAIHERVAAARRRSRRAATLYEEGLARLDDAPPSGYDGGEHLDDAHPYARDLDLLGPGSVYQLLCTARTGVGRRTLADWLLAPAAPAEVRARQQAAEELAPELDLRERLVLLGEESEEGSRPEALVRWAGGDSGLPGGRLPRVVAPTLVALTAATAAAWLAGLAGRGPVTVAALLQTVFGLWLRPRVQGVLAGLSAAARELELLSGVLGQIEAPSVRAPWLRSRQEALATHGTPPSHRIRQLRRRLDLLDSRRNQLFAPVAVLLLWGTQWALAIEAWRRESGAAVADWLRIVGEFEAIVSLATRRYERPDECFPTLVDGPPRLQAEAVGHPLIPADACVRNDVELGEETRLLIVSGSNMAGKSTLLRTVGVNAVLAQAGAPVRATRMTLTPLSVGGSLRVQDSLQEGMSGFYAEIRRLRRLLDLAASAPPLLFLLEELLSTTNSHDRRIGAEAILTELLERGAVGLITTHDLALTRIADALEGVVNVHFADRLEEGRITFDYRLRPGVVERTNAVELMRSIGLDV